MWQSHSVHQSSPSSDVMAGATKLQFNRRELDQAAAAQRAGEAIAYNELESKYSQPVVKFRSEITQERGEGEASSGRTHQTIRVRPTLKVLRHHNRSAQPHAVA